jgi:hypothetical protein
MPAAGTAAPARVPGTAAGDSSTARQFSEPVKSPILLAESWFSKFYRGLVSSLGSRKAMFQFAMVGMLVALWIIWWRK